VARDRGRGQEALNRLGERAPDVAHSIYYADLSRLSEMKNPRALTDKRDLWKGRCRNQDSRPCSRSFRYKFRSLIPRILAAFPR
jgi:hypothetical protein